MEQRLHVIFGTGPLGRSVMEALTARGERVRMVNRSGRMAAAPGTEVVAADLRSTDDAVRAAAGATHIYQCANPPYHQWQELFPALQRAVVHAAVTVKARFISAENLYMYGDVHGTPITETTPYDAQTKKGKVRAAMANELNELHRTGVLQIVTGRGSDFFGPFVLDSMMGERQFGAAVNGKAVSLLGDIDAPHSLTYIKDFGAALATLAMTDSAYGRAWHVPNAPAVSQREFVRLLFRALGTPEKLSVMGKTMLRIGGLFIPAAREVVEMYYEFEKPFLVDSSEFERAFGVQATPLEESIRQTVEWYRSTL